MSQGEHYDDSDLPPIQVHSGGRLSLLGSLFGGPTVERRPAMLGIAVFMIVLVGFIIGTLFTMGILSGLIEIDPKAIKSVLKSILGKH